MNPKKQITLLLFIVINLSAAAQILKVTGKITDKKTGTSLPFAHIQLKNTGLGTISSEKGYFSLKLPNKYINHKIFISAVGYNTQEFQIKNTNTVLKITLEPLDYQIGEVIVMPDSTLLTLLEKAFKKIPDNYPMHPTKLKGFYREAVTTDDGNYLYFAEAVTETYKSSYKNSADIGQIKILKSLVNEFPGLDSLRVRFYGGVFDPTDGDFVMKRFSFINPKDFRNYHFALDGTTKLNDNEVYIINFDTQNDSLKGSRNGKFYLEKSSLAYIGCEYESTQRGIDKYNNRYLTRIKSKGYKRKVSYVKIKDKWHIKYITDEMIFENNHGNTYKVSGEYIASEVFSDSIKPIPFSERIEYGDVFSEKAKNYVSEDYWGEYNILKKDSLLEKQIKLQYDTVLTKNLLTQKTKYTKKSKLFKIISNMGFAYSISYYPFNADKGLYGINYTHNNQTISFSEDLAEFDYGLGLLAQFDYSLNYRWSLNFAVSSSISKKIYVSSYAVGSAYRILLKKQGKPIFLNAGLFISYDNFARKFSIYQNNTEFEFANKKIDAEKLQFGVGFKSLAIKPRISIEYPFGKRLFLRAAASYYFPVYSKEKLYLEEKSGFFLLRKKASIPLTDNSLEISYNGEPTDKSYLKFDNFSLDLGFVLRF